MAYKQGAGRLALAYLTLKFFELEVRFPRHAGELPPAAVSGLGRFGTKSGGSAWTRRKTAPNADVRPLLRGRVDDVPRERS